MGLTIKKRHGNLQTIGLVAMTALIGVSFLLHQVTISAAGANWMDNDPVIKHVRPLDPAVDPNTNVRGHCKLETVTVAKTYEDKNPTMKLTLCLNEFNGWRFGQANGWYDVYASNGGLFYQVRNLSAIHWFKGTDTIIGMHRGHAFDYDEISHLKKYHNFTKRLTMSSSKKSFDFDTSNPAFSLDHNGKPMYAISWGISNNGRYLVYSGSARHVNAYDIFSRIDLETGERKVFGRGYYDHTHNVEPQPSVVVSNDGTQVIIGGTAAFKVWRITPECLIDRDAMKDEFHDPCPARMIHPKFYGDQWKSIEASHERMFANDDFTELTYQHRALRGQAINEVVTISIAKDEPPYSWLDYLAMGDSYSSGEGDIENGFSEFYIKNTGSPKDCHLSARSYPYILAKRQNIKGVQSVACSGARMIHDYVMNPRYYIGQNEVTQKVIKEKGMDNIKDDVLQSFLPGYIPQLEFVKKYKPRMITLTGGGNDVGFGDVLKTCVLDRGTCSYANNPEVILATNNLVYNQYGAARTVIKKLQQASPNSKIFIIGYPQFISDNSDKCEGVGFLNKIERKMIRQHTSRLNNVLRRAAKDSGVQYISIADSLDTGKLCENKKYVTSLADVGIGGLAADALQNAFHPNAAGHALIAKAIDDAIRKEDIDKDRSASSLYDLPQKVILTKRLDMSSMGGVNPGGDVPLKIKGEGLSPGSLLTVKLFSRPTDLPGLKVDKNGDINGNVKIPNEIGAGYHTLLMKGIASSGEEIVFLGTIFVKDAHGDQDGDGVPDVSDRCMGLPPVVKNGKDMCVRSVNKALPEMDHRDVAAGEYSELSQKQNSILIIGAPLVLIIVFSLIIKVRRL